MITVPFSSPFSAETEPPSTCIILLTMESPNSVCKTGLNLLINCIIFKYKGCSLLDSLFY